MLLAGMVIAMYDRKTVLNFHGLGAIPDYVGFDERPYWVPVPKFEEILDEVAIRRAWGQDVEITFDDGNRTDLKIAAPYLCDRKLTAAFFVLTGRLEREGYLTVRDICALLDMGMDIGLHGRDHVDWRRLDAEALKVEIPQARMVLSDIMRKPVSMVSIPFGAYNRRVMSLLARMDFDTIFTSDGGRARQGAQVQPRLTIRADTDVDNIRNLLDGAIRTRESIRRGVKRFLKRYVI